MIRALESYEVALRQHSDRELFWAIENRDQLEQVLYKAFKLSLYLLKKVFISMVIP